MRLLAAIFLVCCGVYMIFCGLFAVAGFVYTLRGYPSDVAVWFWPILAVVYVAIGWFCLKWALNVFNG